MRPRISLLATMGCAEEMLPFPGFLKSCHMTSPTPPILPQSRELCKGRYQGSQDGWDPTAYHTVISASASFSVSLQSLTKPRCPGLPTCLREMLPTLCWQDDQGPSRGVALRCWAALCSRCRLDADTNVFCQTFSILAFVSG